MSLRPKWQNIGKRDWSEVRGIWLGVNPPSNVLNQRPDPGLEGLSTLSALVATNEAVIYSDVEGLRLNALSEAIYLFRKCSRTKSAAQNLAIQGMHSWSLFNAYHSAYIGARGIMNLLGFVTPKLNGQQVGIDLFPLSTPQGSQGKRPGRMLQSQFKLFTLPKLDQRYTWEALQRVVNQSKVKCWTQSLSQQLTDLDYEKITPPRNHFLYKADYWPLEDVLYNLPSSDLEGLLGAELDVEASGFLLQLCFTVYFLFEQLIADMSRDSNLVAAQLSDTKQVLAADDMNLYTFFINQVRVASELTALHVGSD